MSIYPNPVLDQCTIQWEDALSNSVDYQIVDALGRTIRSGMLEAGSTHYQLDVKDLATAVYTIRLQHQQVQLLKKFVKR